MHNLQSKVKQLQQAYNHYCSVLQISQNQIVAVPQVDVINFQSSIVELSDSLKVYSYGVSHSLLQVARTLFINNGFITTFNHYQFGALGVWLNYLSSNDFICSCIKYVVTPWPDINEGLTMLIKDAALAKDRLEYNKVGVTARELYILLAQKVFNKEIHQSICDKKISNTDAVEMLRAFFKYNKVNDEVFKYADAAVNLANTVTHMKTTDDIRLNALVTAVVSLVSIVNNYYRKSN